MKPRRSGTEPARTARTIAHERREPVRHAFHYRHAMWLVDLDAVPDAAARAARRSRRFEARDHLGDPDATLRANVDAYLAEHGIDLDGGRVLMLANPRSFGYVFNPLTVYWCYDDRPTDARRCVVAEVHNTYGGRHCYLAAARRRAAAPSVDKDVLRLAVLRRRRPLRDAVLRAAARSLEVGITLRRGESMEPVFRATLAGHRTVARVRSVEPRRGAARVRELEGHRAHPVAGDPPLAAPRPARAPADRLRAGTDRAAHPGG